MCFFFFWLLWHVGSSSPPRDRTQALLPWQHGVLTTGPPGKSRETFFFFLIFYFFCPMACGILVCRPGIEPGPLVMTARSPSHWNNREFPYAKEFEMLFPPKLLV